jgi:hypothetical protein
VETEEEFRSKKKEEFARNDPSLTEDQLNDLVQSAVDVRNSASKSDEPTAYSWLDQLPPEYQPPGRKLAEGSSRLIEGGGPRTYTGRGLVDSRGYFVRNPDGSVKTLYGPNDVQSVWRGIPYQDKKEIAKYMKAFGVYGGSSPSLNLDQLEDFNAFARVLYTANNEGRTWDVALDTLAKRYQEMPKPTGRIYKPTSIADIRRAMQAQATSILGRGLTPQEAKPLAQRIQQQETRQQTMASGQQPTSTSTLIEQGVQKDFAPEAQAFNFARFAQSALGYAGSSAGAQPDVELETMGGM